MNLTLLAFLVIGIFGLIILTLYLYFRKQYEYWGNRNIPFIKPCFPLGNLENAGKSHIGLIIKKLYSEAKSKGYRFCGIWMFHRPALLIVDPDLIRNILTVDFASFQDHMVNVDRKTDPLIGNNLFALKGQDWKNLKSKISPAFSASKVKTMVPSMVKFSKIMRQEFKSSGEMSIGEVQGLIERYTIDCMSAIAFGVDARCLRNPNSIFIKMKEKFFQTDLAGAIKNALFFIAPDLFQYLKISMFSKEMSKFFIRTLQNSLDGENKSDLLKFLINLKKKEGTAEGKKNEGCQSFSIEETTSQSLMFFVGGTSLPPHMLLYALYSFAENEKIQTKARNEIDRVLAKYNGDINYEAIGEMEYLERIVHETVRKYFVGYGLDRVCTKDYTIPNTDCVIEKGTVVIIPFMGLNWDEEHFPNPEIFDPDRFLEQNLSRHRYSYVPFGEGPRACIGRKIGYLEIMIGLIPLLSTYKFKIIGAPYQSFVEYNPRTYLPMAKNGAKLKISLLENCDE